MNKKSFVYAIIVLTAIWAVFAYLNKQNDSETSITDKSGDMTQNADDDSADSEIGKDDNSQGHMVTESEDDISSSISGNKILNKLELAKQTKINKELTEIRLKRSLQVFPVLSSTELDNYMNGSKLNRKVFKLFKDYLAAGKLNATSYSHFLNFYNRGFIKKKAAYNCFVKFEKDELELVYDVTRNAVVQTITDRKHVEYADMGYLQTIGKILATDWLTKLGKKNKASMKQGLIELKKFYLGCGMYPYLNLSLNGGKLILK